MSITQNLRKSLGGKWTYDNHGSWWCDDEQRRVSRVSAGVDERDEPVGPAQYWLYGDGPPRRAERYICSWEQQFTLDFNNGDLSTTNYEDNHG